MVQGYLHKHKLAIILTMLLIVLVGYATIKLVPVFAKPNDEVFVEGIVGKFTLKQLPLQVLDYMSEGLVTINAEGVPVPNAAESIENDASGKVFTVKLKNELKWHDGSPVLSKDLAYNLPDVTIDRPDDKTLVFTLKDSFAPFPTLLTGPLIKVTADDRILGIGEYELAKAEYHQTQYLYALELKSHTISPKTIRIKFFTTEKDAETAYKLGQIQGMQLTAINTLNGWNNSIFYEKVIPKRFVGVFFNFTDPLVGGKSPQLRQALSYALPEIEGGQPFKGPFPPGSWADTNSENKYRNSPDKAKESLQKYKDANKGSTVELKITLTTLQPYKKTAERVQKAWNDLGVQTEIQIVDKVPDTFQALIVAQEIPSDPDQYSLWHSTQKQSNITGYTNVRVDKDLEDARKTIDLNIRKQKYADFEKQLTDDVPVIYLYQPYSTYILNKKMNMPSIVMLKKFSGQ